MYQGRIVEMASTEAIFGNPLHPYTQELLSAAVDYKAAKREGGIVIDPTARLIDHGNGHYVMEC
jgi:ABC-type oligopeptide transport system ATPase subunit